MPGRNETRKDLVQETVESGATHVGRIATIVTGAVRDVARELGSFATDVFEMREASTRALKDHQVEQDADRALQDDTADQAVIPPADPARKPGDAEEAV